MAMMTMHQLPRGSRSRVVVMGLLLLLLLCRERALAQEFEAIAGWFPQSDVGNHKRIDLDQQEIARLLSEQTPDSFVLAKEIYTNGKNAEGFTLRELSTDGDVQTNVNGTGGSYFEIFQVYADYFGTFDYADRIIEAAYEGTDIDLNGKSFNFSTYWTSGLRGRAQAIEKTGAFGNALLYAIRELEVAVDLCPRGSSSTASSTSNDGTSNSTTNTSTSTTNDATAAAAASSVNAIDRAVAFWTGSLEGTDGTGTGVLSYALAEGRCSEFQTCDSNGTTTTMGPAAVNTKLFAILRSMRDSLLQTDCDSVLKYKENAVQIMFIPVIQSTLLYAYRQNGRLLNTTDSEEGAGAAFSSSILPRIHACSADDAATVYQEMRVHGDFTTDFGAVKAALENNYACLGISCAEVGGIVSSDGVSSNSTKVSYEAGAEPCEGVSGSDDSTSPNTTGGNDADVLDPTGSSGDEPTTTERTSQADRALFSQPMGKQLVALVVVAASWVASC